MADSSWLEPDSAANTDYPPVYPFNHINQTESGHYMEMDDTPTRERVRIHHRTGTFIEMHPNGDEVHKVYGDGYEITIKNKNVLIKGACNITVEGDSTFHVKGDAYTQIDGNAYQSVKGNMSQLVSGNCEQTVEGDFDFNVGGDVTFSGESVNINGDLNVSGDIASNQSIAAVGNITAGKNLSATMSVQTVGYMLAGVSMSAPLGTFGVMNSMWMRDSVNEAIFNAHFHMSPKGPTTPPLLHMI